MSGHTPGPWQCHYDWDNTGYPCFFIHGMSGDGKRDRLTLAANVAVIEAAPELLAALKAVIGPGGLFRYDRLTAANAEAARAAIAKAEGRS